MSKKASSWPPGKNKRRTDGRRGEDEMEVDPPGVDAADVTQPEQEDAYYAERDLNELLGEAEPLPDAEESEGEDIFDDEVVAKDYEANSELDYYSQDGLSEGSYEEVDVGDRREIEKQLAERDWREGRTTLATNAQGARIPSALLGAIDIGDDGVVDRPFMRRRRRRGGDDGSDGRGGPSDSDPDGDDDSEDSENDPNLEQPQGSLREYILTVGRSAIAQRFRRFLRSFQNEKGHLVYKERIMELGKANKSSLEVSWDHLSKGEEVPILATWLVEAPAEMLPILNEIARKEVLREFPSYDHISDQIFVRISSLPVADNLRDLRQTHLNAFIRVTGVVTRRSSVMPQLLFTKYNCAKCGSVLGPYSQANTTKEVKPTICTECQEHGPFPLNLELSVYRNFQTVNLQETPGSIPPGRLPRSREVILLNDLVDTIRPGDEIEVTGIYTNHFDGRLNKKNGFPVFKTLIEANHVYKHEDVYDSFRMTEDDENIIIRLSKDEHIGERIIKSIAPSIHGHLDIKTGLALALFGGEPKQLEGDHRTRGDINVLLLGDPGTAKSQFLKYIEKTAHRAVYTTGQGASAVGLTAAVRKDPITREFTLEGGALVLADRGMCMIDEFDKMNDKDRTSIHEAMEQQSISISKAGIVTSLRARCSVIAAANPVRGRYDASLPFSKNVELTDAILSRFDVTCVVRDVVDFENDKALAGFVVGSHTRSHPHFEQYSDQIELASHGFNHPGEQVATGSSSNGTDHEETGPLSQDLLRKYIMYAKANIHPRLTDQSDINKIVNVYVEMRKEGNRGGVPMTVRHVESMIRMSEAHAKMHLRTVCTDDDVNMAIRVMLNSFIQSQKFSVSQEMKRKFRKYLNYKRDNNDLLYSLLAQIIKEHVIQHQVKVGYLPETIEAPFSELESRAKEQFDITDLRAFYRSNTATRSGVKVDIARRVFIKTL